jgi:hypothetical protein
MVASTLLGIVYLAPIAIRGLLPPAGDLPPPDFIRPGGAPALAVIPAAVTAAMCLVLFFAAGAIVDFLAPIEGGAP